MPPLIPTEQWNALSLAIARGDNDRVKALVEEHALDVNSFDDSSWMPVLMEVLLSYGFSSETERRSLLLYLLEKGANPNLCSRKGYNCLHIAVQQERYSQALELFLDFDADVNVTDADGCSVVYWAIQTFLLRKGDADSKANSLRVLEKMLSLGADLDLTNRYGMTARGWLQHAAPEVRELVARWESGKPKVRPAHTVQPVFPKNLRYPGLAQRIWNMKLSSVHASDPLPGELLRAVENLRDEAQRHGNVNYRKSHHKRMAVFVRDTLVKSGVFDANDNERIKSDTHKLMKASRPYLEDDVYDQLVDRVCIYYTQKEMPAALL